ncbi:MAG: HMA2 domain-containing protein, partial [Dehalobacterium sp.]
MEPSIVEVVHHLPGRVRFKVSFLHRNPEAKLFLEKELGNLPGIIKAAANPITGSLLIYFDCASLSVNQLRNYILKPLLGQQEAAAVNHADLCPRNWGIKKRLPLAALPTFSALLTLILTGSRQRAVLPLMGGYPLALNLTTALPQSILINRGTGDGWAALRPDTVNCSAGIDTVLFSDTTLISGHQQEIKDIISLDPAYSNEQLLLIATAAYQHQEGPLARNLVHRCQIAQLPLLTLDRLIWEKGKGIKGFLENHPVLVGNAKLLKGEGVSVSSALPFVWRLKHLNQNPLYISVNNKLIGLVGISHEINHTNRALLESLRAAGITRFGIFRED